MKTLSITIILAIFAVASAQFPFWKKFDTAVCYQFYGECLTKYSHRAASESQFCEETRNSSLFAANSTFNESMEKLFGGIRNIQKRISCGSLKAKEQQDCFSNIARNNIIILKDIENNSIKAYRAHAEQEATAVAICDGCLSKINLEISEAIQEIDNILRSCYVTGKSVSPKHPWYTDRTAASSTTSPYPSHYTPEYNISASVFQ